MNASTDNGYDESLATYATSVALDCRVTLTDALRRIEGAAYETALQARVPVDYVRDWCRRMVVELSQ